MIEVKCGNCGKSFRAKDEHAGKTTKCPNCGSPLTIQAAGAPVGAAQAPAEQAPAQQAPPQPETPVDGPPAAAGEGPAGTTVVVQMQQAEQPRTDLIGSAGKSKIVCFLLSGVCPGLQYFYLGQTGKGILFTLLSLFLWGPVVFFTCGLGLIGAIPYGIVLLIDSMIIAGRISKEAVKPWRFF